VRGRETQAVPTIRIQLPLYREVVMRGRWHWLFIGLLTGAVGLTPDLAGSPVWGEPNPPKLSLTERAKVQDNASKSGPQTCGGSSLWVAGFLIPQTSHCPDVGCEVEDECVWYGSSTCGCVFGNFPGSRCRPQSWGLCTGATCIGACCCGCPCRTDAGYKCNFPPGGGDCGNCRPCPYEPAGCGIPHSRRSMPPTPNPPFRRVP